LIFSAAEQLALVSDLQLLHLTHFLLWLLLHQDELMVLILNAEG
jgi:hypothetical protein